MHSRFVSISVIVAISFLPILWETEAKAADWFDGQEILVECPVWEWAPSSIPGIAYELCFDDIDHCTVAEIGDSVCIPSLGVHAVWVTAIEYLTTGPIYYDGDIVPIERVVTADFTGDGVVGMEDMGIFVQYFSEGTGGPGDLDGDGVVGILDFSHFRRAYGKCVNASGTVYEPC